MIAVLRAVTWKFYRQNRWWVGLALCAIAGITKLAYKVPLATYDSNDQTVHFTVFISEILAFGFLLLISQYSKRKGRLGFPEHLFIKPVSIRLIAAIRLPLSMGLAVLLYLVTALCFYWATDMRWPLALPSLYLAAAILFVQAMAWSLPAEPALQILFTCVGGIVLCVQYYHDLHSGTNALRIVGLLIFMILSTWLAITGASLDRRSQRLSLLTLWNKITATLLVLLPWKTCTDASPQKALFWFHWVRKGWVIPFLSLLLMALGYVLCLVNWDDRATFIEGYFTAIFILHVAIFPFLSAIILCQQEARSQGMPVYMNCLPVTNPTLLRIYLKSALLSLVLSWMIYAGGMALLYLIFQLVGQTHVMNNLLNQLGGGILTAFIGIRNTNTDNYGIFSIPGGYFLLAWTSFGLAGSMVLTGRRYITGLSFAFIFLLPIIPNIAMSLQAPVVMVNALYALEAWIYILVIMGGTIAAYGVATRKRMIPPYLTIVSGLFCLIWFIVNHHFIFQGSPWGEFMIRLVALHMDGDWSELQDTLLTALTIITIGFLPIAPLAIAPLALAWNRHR